MAVKKTVIRPFTFGVVPGLVLIVGILYMAKSVLVPLVLAILLTILLAPLVRQIQHVTIRRIPAVILTVIFAFGLLGAIGWAAGSQLNDLAKELPQQKQKIQQKIQDLRNSGTTLGKVLEMVRDLGNEAEKLPQPTNDQNIPQPKPLIVTSENNTSSLEVFANTVIPFLSPLVTFALVVILVVFMLVEREDLRDRLIALFGQGKITTTTRMIDDATQRLSRYLLTQSAINLGFAIILSIGLLIIDVPYAFLWGILAGIMRFVPYIGTWIAGFFPVLLSFALSPDWSQPIIVAAFYACLEFFTGNVVEPYLVGQRIGVIPITLLVAAVFWTWIWGPIGLVLSTPLTVCLVVIAQNFPRLKALTVLLSDQAALTAHVRFYQRLLAKDQEEARQLVQEQVKSFGLENVCDHLLLPAMLVVQRDHREENLTADEEEYVLHQTQELVKQLEVDGAAVPVEHAISTSNGQKKTSPRILVIGPETPEGVEDISLQMLRLVLKAKDYRIDVLPVNASQEDVQSQMQQDRPLVILLPVLPPRNFSMVTKVVQELRSRFPEVPVIIGCWGAIHLSSRRRSKLRSAGASSVVLTFRQTRESIQEIANATQRKGSEKKILQTV